MTTLLTEPETDIVLDREIETSNDKPNVAHLFVSPNPDESHHGYIMRARIEGFPVTALCGHVMVITKSAQGLPVCAECKDIWDSLDAFDDGTGRFPNE